MWFFSNPLIWIAAGLIIARLSRSEGVFWTKTRIFQLGLLVMSTSVAIFGWDHAARIGASMMSSLLIGLIFFEASERAYEVISFNFSPPPSALKGESVGGVLSETPHFWREADKSSSPKYPASSRKGFRMRDLSEIGLDLRRRERRQEYQS